MATITLFANRINNLPEIIRDAKSSVNTFKGDLGSLITSALQVDGDICSLDDTISSLRSSTDTQEEKIDALEDIADDIEDFIDEVVSIDEDAADAINQSKDDFYDEYYYLKPDCEKSGWEKFKDGLKAVGEWCKEHWKFIVTVVIVIAAIVCLFVPGVNAAIAGMVFGKIILGAAAGALMGAISGGLMGGIMSALTGGSFFEGFEEGAFSGALTGALMGGLGGAGEILGESIKCVSTLGKAVKATAKISSILSSGMGLFDSAAMVIGMFDPDNAFVRFNQRLHESKLYNGIQFGIDGLAALTGGMTKTMKCFVAGTMIATVSGLVAIENIRVGDRVMATDPETGETAAKTVLETYIREAETLIHICVGGEELITTETHPFYVKGRGFVDAEELRQGDELLDINGNVTVIESIEIEKAEPTKVYNFQVEDFHTYHVGENGILVHNANELYNELRKVSPDNAAKKAVNDVEGKKVDPVYGYEVDVLEADHIVPLKEIVEMPGFDQLSFEDQKAIANLRENFMGLGKRTNASKGAKPLSQWTGHSQLGPISDSVRSMLNMRDSAARTAITNAIAEALGKGGKK